MKHSHLLYAAALGVLVTACADEPAGPEPTHAPRFSQAVAEGSYILVAGGNKLPAGLAAAVAKAGGTLVATMDDIGVATATSADPNFVAKASKISGVAVAADVLVEWAQPTKVVDVDEATSQSLASDERFAAIQWSLDAVDAPEAWDAGARGAGVRVAVLDGGIYAAHPDLAGRVDVARSVSFAPTPFDHDLGTFWHGTHVAGIIAANDNGAGSIGIAPGATIIGVKVLHGGTGQFSWMINGLYYASTPIEAGGAGADIINMSLGALFPRQGAGNNLLIVAMTRAANYAYQQGTTIFASAGNNGVDLDHTANWVAMPAQLPNVITVSASAPMGWALGATNFERPASYTNYGRSAIDVGGPGGDGALPGNAVCTVPANTGSPITHFCWVFDLVLSTSRGTTAAGGYSWAGGTSMSSPAAAAVGALIIEKFGRIGPAQVEAKVRESTGANGNDPYLGAGYVNAFRAIQ